MNAKRILIQICMAAALALTALTCGAQAVTAAAGGGFHSLFLKSDGSLWGMGLSYYGELGDGIYYFAPYGTNRPETILGASGPTTITAVSAGIFHSLFLKSDGSLWGMGYNEDGELGNGSIVNTNVPVEIVGYDPAFPVVTAVSARSHHSLFLKSDGSLWGMGFNDYGELGAIAPEGDSTNRPETIVPGGVTAISAGGYHTLYIMSGGSLWGLGGDGYGQLGNGRDGTYTNKPVEVLPNGVAAISAGGGHSLFLKSNGSLWGMGDDTHGQLGVSRLYRSFTNRPVQIVANGVKAFAAGDEHSLLLMMDGSLWGMGSGEFGDLGGNQTNDVIIPKMIVPNGVTSIACGGGFSLFTKSDGSLWAMGLNNWGQLGDGSVKRTVLSPEMIMPGPPGANSNLLVKITNVPAGLIVSNAAFTVKGDTGGKGTVTNVEVSVKSGSWNSASQGNGWSNWTALVTLVPGTNTIQAFAVDSSGNVSTTNTVKLDFVPSAVLTVITNGEGAITPNYNGATLQIGKSYALRARADSGFAFADWTDGAGNVLTNGATLKFQMESNLTLVAVFKDITPPRLSITTPTANERWSNSVFTMTGKASDNVAVSNVFYSLNSHAPTNASGENKWSNWTATLALQPGANTIAAYALDTAGNFSSTNKVTFFYIPSATLIVQTNGNGGIAPADNGKLLAIGTNYTLTASPGRNWLFSNWVGGITTPYAQLGTNPACAFRMQSNFVLQANFVTNFFLAAQGNYYGLFAPADPPRRQTNSGSFTLTVGPDGSVSGDLYLGADKIPFSNTKFNLGGMAQFVATPVGGKPLTIALQLNLAGQSVQGTVTDGSFIANLSGDQAMFTSMHQATNYEGQYTFIIPGTNDSAIGPFGTSFGTVTVSPDGTLKFVGGSLADGTTGLSQSSGVSKDGYWPFYVPLYNGAGSLWGWNCFSNHTLTSSNYISWINPTNATQGALYRSGFTNEQTTVVISLYTPASAPLLSLTGGQVILEGGNLPFGITNQIKWASNNSITAPTNIAGNTNGLELTITSPGSGLITGSILNPADKSQTIPIHGILLQNQTNARGWFAGTNQSGTFLLGNP